MSTPRMILSNMAGLQAPPAERYGTWSNGGTEALPVVFIPRRLDKYLREATALSVVTAREALLSGRVEVNRGTAREEQRLVFDDDQVTLDGEIVTPRVRHAHIMLNKPLSVTSTARDPDGRADLSSFIAQMPTGVFPIGRLDRMTSGLLLFTTDGDLAHAVLHPDHHTEKLYWLWLNEHVADDDPRLKQLTTGVTVLGKLARAKAVTVHHRSPDFTELLVTLAEGKNRQIRRMARALDFYLHGLHRLAVGPLTLAGLPQGQHRDLSPDEVEGLWQATGGRERAQARKLVALEKLARQSRVSGRPDTRLEAWLRGVR